MSPRGLHHGFAWQVFPMFLLAGMWWSCLCLGSSDIRGVGKGKGRDGVDGDVSCIYPPPLHPGAQQKVWGGRLRRVEATACFYQEHCILLSVWFLLWSMSVPTHSCHAGEP